MFGIAAVHFVRLEGVARPRFCPGRGHAQRWYVATGDGFGDTEGKPNQKPKRAAGGRARVARRRTPPGSGETSSAPRRAVRKTSPTGSPNDRGVMRSDEEKARAMVELKRKAAAPAVKALAEKVSEACASDAHRDAAAAYSNLKRIQDGVVPKEVFESMLQMYGRLIMTASAEGVFIDALTAGVEPGEEICWALVRAFERAEEKDRADKVLAYMESRGMV